MSSAAFLKWMGLGQSGKSVADDECFDEGERYFGLENFGNTCYSNSVVQALYYCKPFRECITNFPVPAALPTNPLGRSSSAHVNPTSPTSSSRPTFLSTSSSSSAVPTSRLSNGLHNGMSTNSHPSLPNRPSGSAQSTSNVPNTSSLGSSAVGSSQHERDNVGDISLSPGMEDTLFAALKDLFWKIATHKKKTGVVAPVNFINKVKKENELFRSSMHQDAHEFLNYLLNSIAEDVERYQKKIAQESASNGGANGSDKSTKSDSSPHQHSTWVHQLFEGVFSNETKCLTCETVTSRDESFMDLSIDVEMNSSVTSCLRQFSASETLCHKNKYFCDVCCGLQEAERRMKIKKLPNILALHLKRFKYQEQLQKYIKLTYRVVFPFELRLFNTCDDTEDPDRMYELWACVIHIGSGPHHGHYVTIIKSNGQWMLFDDDVVTPIQEDEIQKYFGDLPGSGSGYVLFYQAVNLTMDSIDLWNGNDMKANPSYMHANGRPSATLEIHEQQQYESQSSHISSPTTASYPNRIDSPLRKAEARYNINPPSTPTSPLPPPPLSSEDKKSRWGLRKIMEKSTSKR